MKIPCCNTYMEMSSTGLICPECGRFLEFEAVVDDESQDQSPDVLRSQTGRANKLAGDASETVAEIALAAAGLARIRKIETGWGIQREGGCIVSAWPLPKPVQGDYTAIIPGTGRSVLVEVKSRSERDTLRWSDFEPHQIEELSEHARLGGLSLVVWLPPSGNVYLMDWATIRQTPWPGFRKHHSLSEKDAARCQWSL